MKVLKIISSCLVMAMLGFTSCEDYFEPSPNNDQDESLVYSRAPFAEGLLLKAYTGLPTGYSFEESASDDAVTNVIGRNYKRMSTGEWTSQFNPVSVWSSAYQNIFYLNYFLSLVDSVNWNSTSDQQQEMWVNRFSGEAYALRAWYNLSLLQNHGGMGKDGNMLGFIILDEYVEPAALDPNLPRDSYEDCVDYILEDCDRAIDLLPMDYVTIPGESDSTLILGPQNVNRVSGRHAMAIKSKVALLAASPAFNTDNTAAKWELAAQTAGDLLEDISGVAGMAADGVKWYLNRNSTEILWRHDYFTGLGWESQNFPPSLFGNGRDNPTQNFVDAFPMDDGTPITESGAYDPADPYANRDPRLAAYVIYNGNTIGTIVINTNIESNQDGIGNILTSTVTGYYTKKLLNESVRLTPGNQNQTVHFFTLMRYTEIFLNYAEAANEAWGPDADPEGYGFTARDVIGAIRERAGITQPDAYLATVTTKEDMRELIRNERRIELSFEGFRFWDIRRWDLPLNETAKGMRIQGGVHTVIDVEVRDYDAHMKYGPIPYRETLINTNLVQNKDW